MSFETSALIVTWAAIALLALAMSGLLRQIRILSSSITTRTPQLGPTVGVVAPELEGYPARWTKPAILMFLDSNCGTCQQVLRAFSDLARTNGQDFAYVAVFRDDPDTTAGAEVQVTSDQRAAFQRFRIPVTPFGVILDRSGVTQAARPVGSMEMLEEFLQGVNERSLEHASPAQ